MLQATLYLVILIFQIYFCKAQNYQTCASAEIDDVTMLQSSRRVVGDSINATYAPFQVALLVKQVALLVKIHFQCGGTILSQRYVLTASHCVDFHPAPEDLLFIVYGSLNHCRVAEQIKKDPYNDGPWKNVVRAEKVFKHPDYTTYDTNDIAIIKVQHGVIHLSNKSYNWI